eukprot:2987338-Alexandrium_andersonii.AAC.1
MLALPRQYAGYAPTSWSLHDILETVFEDERFDGARNTAAQRSGEEQYMGRRRSAARDIVALR